MSNKEYLYEIEKSKFYTVIFESVDEQEILNFIGDINIKHKKASHIIYVYKIDNKIKVFEDKEPKRSCGYPILDLIQMKMLNNIAIIVIRYYGGIKLGKGKLIRSYLYGPKQILK